MTDVATVSTPAIPAPSSPPSDELTKVELVWIEKQIEHWMRFGREVREQIIDRRRRILFFPPGVIMALVRWAANAHGTIVSQLDILRTVRHGELCQTVPTIAPGGDILLRISGWPKVERTLHLIDAIEAQGIDPADVSSDYWRHVHNRLSVGETPRRYSLQRHHAFLLMQRIGE